MVAEISISPNALPTVTFEEEAVRVAGLVGYAKLEEVFDQPPAVVMAYLNAVGYGPEWRYFRMEFGEEARAAFLAWVRKDMGF